MCGDGRADVAMPVAPVTPAAATATVPHGAARPRGRFARARAAGGFTLVEMLLAIVVIGVGLAGVMAAFSVGVRSSADPVVREQMLSIAEEMLEEVTLKPFAPVPNTEATSGCSRAAFNDVSDYNGYAPGKICDVAGNTIGGTDGSMAGYAVSVAVDSPGFNGIAAGDTKRISVTVTRGGESLTLVGWRTNYAGS